MTIYNRVFWLTLGGVTGGFVGYLVADLLIYKFEQNEVEEEMTGTPINKFGQDEVEEDKDEENETPVFDYTKKSKPDLSNLASIYQTSSIGENVTSRKKIPRPWLVITDKDYALSQGFGKAEVAYYAVDEKYCYSENDELVSVPDELFGPDILGFLGRFSEDPDVVYVRNVNTLTDYEITKIDASYSVMVLGLTDEDVEKESIQKRPSRKKKATNGDSNDV